MRLIALFLILCCGTAYANEAVPALSMHDQPKYQADFLHLDYAKPDAPKGGMLTQSVIGTFDTLNAYNIKGKKASGLDLIYDPLMRRVWDEPFSLYGLIAQEVIVPEDRSSVTYILNPNARFHDGRPITAEDVAYSYEQHKKYGKPITRQVYGLAQNVEIIDKQTIRFDFGTGYDAETVMILSLMGVIPKHYWEGKDFSTTTLEPPLGSGPYYIQNLDAGRQIVFERVTDYWAADLPVNRGHYNFDTLVFDYYRDETVAFEAFKAGETDVWREQDIGRWVSGYEDVPQISRHAFKHGRPEWLRSLIFNTRKEIFQDLDIRRALRLAFPYEWVNKTLFHDEYQVITSVFSNSVLAAENNVLRQELLQPERQKLRTASNILKKAGWSVEGGVLQKERQTFTFEILLNNPRDEKIALTFARNLEKLGIQVSIRPVDSAQFLGRLNDFDYDMVFYRWVNSLSPGNEQFIYWGSEAADQIGTRNYAGVRDPAIDQLIAEMANAKDYNVLVEKAQALDNHIMGGAYFIPLFYQGADHLAYQQGVKHPEITPIYGPVLETWWRD